MKNFNLENVDCHAALAMTKNAQSGRSLLPICETDAPLFLSDVYNKRYTSEKTTSRCPQSGRSMIEMLGVLAIIGVLSVGGIAGYSKAMQKYRINKAIEQITLIAGNVRAFFAPQKNYQGLSYNIAKKAKLVPEEMYGTDVDVSYRRFINVFGLYTNLGAARRNTNTDQQAFYIYYYLPVDNEVCIELLSQDWTSVNIKGIMLFAEDERNMPKLTFPVSLDDAVSTCSSMVDEAERTNFSYIGAAIYFDVNSNCWNETSGNTCS